MLLERVQHVMWPGSNLVDAARLVMELTGRDRSFILPPRRVLSSSEP
jgi:hypothetical protein